MGISLGGENVLVGFTFPEDVSTYKYEETNVAAFQLPFVKTVKPPVRRKSVQLISANQEEYASREVSAGDRQRDTESGFKQKKASYAVTYASTSDAMGAPL